MAEWQEFYEKTCFELKAKAYEDALARGNKEGQEVFFCD
jgi:hypothetical protein